MGRADNPAPHVMDLVAMSGSQATLYSIDNQLAQELTYAERIIWKKRAYELGLPMHFDQQIERVERRGNKLLAYFRNLATGMTSEKAADQVIVEHGTKPADSLYHSLRHGASNAGVTDLGALLAVKEQPQLLNAQGGFELHRVGDAVASRNVHSAILDAMRLCRAL